jgi:hypothetical protein
VDRARKKGEELGSVIPRTMESIMHSRIMRRLHIEQNKKSSRKFLTALCIISAFVFFFVLSGYQSASAQTAKAIELKIGNQDPPVHFSQRRTKA